MENRKPGNPRTEKTKTRQTVTLDTELLKDAKELGIKISPACEDGLGRAVKKARKEQENDG